MSLALELVFGSPIPKLGCLSRGGACSCLNFLHHALLSPIGRPAPFLMGMEEEWMRRIGRREVRGRRGGNGKRRRGNCGQHVR